MNMTEAASTIIAILVGVGWLIKNKSPVENGWIPIILCAGATVLLPLFMGVWTDPMLYAQGFLTGLGAVGAHSGTASTVDAVKSGKITQ